MSDSIQSAERAGTAAGDVQRLACLNCGMPLHGEFCAGCGQRVGPVDPGVREIVHDAWEAFTNLDGKVWRSLKLLVLKPGQLTRHYVEGRKAGFLTPVRIYLVCSIAFFLAQSFGPPSFSPSRPDTPPASRPVAANAAPADPSRVDRGYRRLKVNTGPIEDEIARRLPNAMFVVMPIFAVLLQRLYRSRRRRFPAHLVFSLHIHAFFFGLLALMNAGSKLVRLPLGPRSAVLLLAIAWFLAYVATAMRTVYGGRWGPTILRLGTLAVTYLLSVVVTTLVAVIAIAWIVGG